MLVQIPLSANSTSVSSAFAESMIAIIAITAHNPLLPAVRMLVLWLIVRLADHLGACDNVFSAISAQFMRSACGNFCRYRIAKPVYNEAVGAQEHSCCRADGKS